MPVGSNMLRSACAVYCNRHGKPPLPGHAVAFFEMPSVGLRENVKRENENELPLRLSGFLLTARQLRRIRSRRTAACLSLEPLGVLLCRREV